MQSGGDELLAGAGFARDEHGSPTPRHLLDRLEDHLHLARGSNQVFEFTSVVQPCPQHASIVTEVTLFEHPL
jgi:hypothetical protein